MIWEFVRDFETWVLGLAWPYQVLLNLACVVLAWLVFHKIRRLMSDGVEEEN